MYLKFNFNVVAKHLKLVKFRQCTGLKENSKLVTCWNVPLQSDIREDQKQIETFSVSQTNECSRMCRLGMPEVHCSSLLILYWGKLKLLRYQTVYH